MVEPLSLAPVRPVRRWRMGAAAWLLLALALVAAAVWIERGQLVEAAEPLRHASVPLAGLAVALLMTVELAKAARWHALYGEQRPPYRRVLQAVVLGLAANAVIPIRVGELLRVSVASPSASGLARGTASLVLSKAIDALVLAIVAVVAFGGPISGHPLGILGAGAVVGMLILSVAARRLGPRLRLAHRTLRQLLGATLVYARELDSRTLLVVLATSALAWAAGAAANGVVLASIGVTPTIDLALRVLASGYLAGLVPAPPGRIGVFEAAVAAALVSGGLPLPTALAAAVLLHVLQLGQIVLLAVPAARWR